MLGLLKSAIFFFTCKKIICSSVWLGCVLYTFTNFFCLFTVFNTLELLFLISFQPARMSFMQWQLWERIRGSSIDVLQSTEEIAQGCSSPAVCRHLLVSFWRNLSYLWCRINLAPTLCPIGPLIRYAAVFSLYESRECFEYVAFLEVQVPNLVMTRKSGTSIDQTWEQGANESDG